MWLGILIQLPYELELDEMELVMLADELFVRSLATQVSHLFGSLEYHLLGNHLLENAKALIFAGCF